MNTEMPTSFTFPYIQTKGGPGAYCDALPTGEFIVYLPGQWCETHLGRIDFYDGRNEPLFPRINPLMPFTFAGQGHLSDQCIEWDGQWKLHSEKVYGVSGLIYDRNGALHLATLATGSQGYRYVTNDNVLVTGDATYGPKPGIPLCEWTQLLPDLYIGQGTGDGGIYVVDRGVVREMIPLSHGLCRFIRAWLDPLTGRTAITWWGEGTITAEGRFPTVDELRALPVYTKPTPTPIPPTPVPPTPAPPEVPVNIPDNVMARIREFVAAFPVPQASDAVIADAAALARWINTELREGWTLHLAQQLCYDFGADWSSKGTSSTWKSKESIARLRDGKMDVWDMLKGAATGRPVFVETPGHHYVGIDDGAHRIAAIPVDHIGRLLESPIVRAPLRHKRTATSMDWAEHRELSWLRFLEDIGKPAMRLVVWSEFRHEDDFDQIPTFDEALRNFEDALKVLRTEGHTAVPTLHCDTGKRGDTKDEIRDRTRQLNAVMVEYLDVIVAARLFNEGTHSVEASFIANPNFCLELDAMIDPRIPLAWFANHGGEPVTAASAGGSWIAYHSDRSKTPEENAAIMLAAQIRFNKPVWNDEPIGADALAQPGKRVNDPDWFRRQAEADRVLGGSTYHFSAGLWAEVRLLDDVQREAGRLWAGVSGPSVEGPVTPEEIAQVVAGLFFEDISKLLKLAGVGTPGTEPARRPAVHAWATARIEFLVGSYKRVFKRALDLEGAGSWILWAIKGKTDEWIEAEQVKAYARGER